MNEDVLRPYQLRTVRTGVIATVLVLSALALVPLLGPHPEIMRLPYYALVGTALLGGLGVACLPWRSLFERGLGMRFMYAWSILDILLIAGVVASTGGASSDFFWVFTLTTFFFASSYPPRSQLALLSLTLAVYLATLSLTREPIDAGSVLARFAILGTLTFMAAFLFRELMRLMTAHSEARAESERRAVLLSAVAKATRAMTSLDPDEVLASVTEGTLSLGFEANALCIYDDLSNTYRTFYPHGLPQEFVSSPLPADRGMPALVLQHRRTIVVDDYSAHPLAQPLLRATGLRSTIASPVWVEGRLEGALVAGTHRVIQIRPEDIEAVELLAFQAGRALENARRYEEERRTAENLAKLDQLKSDFLSNVSHELRTPLTVIEGMGITLEERWDEIDDDRRRDFLRRMNANAWTLDGVITRLLDFSRLEAGGMELHQEPVDAGDLIRQVVGRLSSLSADDTVSTRIRGPVHVWADRGLLDRVVENLLSNAIKHNPAGTSIDISLTYVGRSAVFAVVDTGSGIPPEDLRHLGERFFRGGDTNTRATRGTGLGLAFVRQILELHGTSLEIESTLGKGSRFSFRLPLAEPDIEIEQISESRVASWT
jgi:signal transduction histidine kinase